MMKPNKMSLQSRKFDVDAKLLPKAKRSHPSKGMTSLFCFRKFKLYFVFKGC